MLSVRINGSAVPLPAYVQRDYAITLGLGSIANEARVKIRDEDLIYEPIENQIIELINEDGAIVFDGLITIKEVEDTALGRLWNLVAAGWTWELDRRIVHGATYLNATDQYILAATQADQDLAKTNPVGVIALTTPIGAPAYDTTNVNASRVVHPSFQYEGVSVRAILDEQSRGSGHLYWIDPGRRVNYVLPQNLAHSGITLSDDETIGIRPRDFRCKTDISQLVTRVLVIGGFGIRPNETVVYPTITGSTLILGYRWTPDHDEEFITIERNTGTDAAPSWSPQSVGFLGETYDTPPQVIWDPVSSTLAFSSPLSEMNQGVRVTGTQRFSAITRQDDLEAIEKYGILEGVIKDRSLITRDRVLYRAQAILNERASASFSASGALNQYIPVGKLVRIKSSKFNVDRDYVVTSVQVIAEGVRELYRYQFAGIAGSIIS